MNIYEKVAAITAELGVISKGLEIAVSKYNKYKAVSERDVIDAVKPLEEKYKVYSYPADRDIVESAVLTKESKYGDDVTKTNSLFMRIVTTYRFVNLEDPSDIMETKVYGDGIDTGDKAPGKAMTYADKYALMKAYKISTGDDPDKEASPERGYEKAPSFTPATPKGAEPEAKPEPLKMTVPEMIEVIHRLYSPEQQDTLAKNHAVATIDDITEDELSALMGRLRKAGKL